MRYIKKKEMRSTAYSQEVLDLANKYRLEPHKIKYVICSCEFIVLDLYN